MIAFYTGLHFKVVEYCSNPYQVGHNNDKYRSSHGQINDDRSFKLCKCDQVSPYDSQTSQYHLDRQAIHQGHHILKKFFSCQTELD